MAREGGASDPRPETFRSYPELLARAGLDPRPRGKLGPAGLVEQTPPRAISAHDRFRGDDAGRAAWLGTMPARAMIDAVSKFGRPGRGRLQRSLEVELEHSSARPEAFRAAAPTSPPGLPGAGSSGP